jgi:hypothetical protein
MVSFQCQRWKTTAAATSQPVEKALYSPENEKEVELIYKSAVVASHLGGMLQIYSVLLHRESLASRLNSLRPRSRKCRALPGLAVDRYSWQMSRFCAQPNGQLRTSRHACPALTRLSPLAFSRGDAAAGHAGPAARASRAVFV